MIAQPHFNPMSPQEYLAWEAQQEAKYAFVDGEVFAMTGGTIPHNQVALNLASALNAHLRGKGCLVVMADVKVQLSPRGPYHYPDVMVSCDDRDRTAIKLIQHPCLIVEVLSPTTAAYDRGDKFTHYRQCPTLQEYLLVDTQAISVDRYRRLSPQRWELQTYGAGETLELTSVDWAAPLELLYEEVQLNPDIEAI
ncbi:MAG TPA: Uma2 family endonuclease [Candidatus Obscuribacterales bacterium]